MKFVVNPQIEGPSVLPDSAWYYLRNVPSGATITWSINNTIILKKNYELVSPQGRDSMYVALRTSSPISPHFPFGKVGDESSNNEVYVPSISLPNRCVLTVTITADGESYSVSKNIRSGNMPFTSNEPAYIQENLPNAGNYTLEFWHSIYGLMRTLETQNADERIDTNGLPQGVYIILKKTSTGGIISQEKIFIP